MFPESAVEFVAQGPAEYGSSEEATRYFCSRCGTQLAFRASYIPGFIDITIGSLDNPEDIVPTLHYWYSRHLSWVVFDDALPKHPEFPPNDGA